MNEEENARNYFQVLSQHFHGEKLPKAAVRIVCLEDVILPLLHSIMLRLTSSFTLYSVLSETGCTSNSYT
jgi:hypothetical protein